MLGALVCSEQYEAALALGFVAALSDAADGYIARRYNMTSAFGGAPVHETRWFCVAFVCFCFVRQARWSHCRAIGPVSCDCTRCLAAILFCMENVIYRR